jgi:hypothetical protein
MPIINVHAHFGGRSSAPNSPRKLKSGNKRPIDLADSDSDIDELDAVEDVKMDAVINHLSKVQPAAEYHRYLATLRNSNIIYATALRSDFDNAVRQLISCKIPKNLAPALVRVAKQLVKHHAKNMRQAKRARRASTVKQEEKENIVVPNDDEPIVISDDSDDDDNY